jgi:hypothetical protein
LPSSLIINFNENRIMGGRSDRRPLQLYR